MNLPQIYMCSPSWTLLPPPSPFHPSGSSQCTSPKHPVILKDPDAGKDWGQEEKGTTEDEMVGWHHWLDGPGFVWTLGFGDGQGGLVCCGSWGRKVGHDWATELNWHIVNFLSRHTTQPIYSFWLGKNPIYLRMSTFQSHEDLSFTVLRCNQNTDFCLTHRENQLKVFSQKAWEFHQSALSFEIKPLTGKQINLSAFIFPVCSVWRML